MSLWELKNRTMNLFKTFGGFQNCSLMTSRKVVGGQMRDLQSGYLLSSYSFCGFSEVHSYTAFAIGATKLKYKVM